MKRLVLLVLVAGCSSSTTAPAPTTGSLTVTVTSSGSVTPNVTVKGPNGFTKSITATASLTGLTPGSYTIAAASITTTDSIVASVYEGAVTGSPATVTAGGNAAVTVHYALRPGTGSLWVVGGTIAGSNVQNTAIAYTRGQLQSSHSALPSIALDLPVTPNASDAVGVAFDVLGNLWILNNYTRTVVEYLIAGIGASGSPTPAVTLHLRDSSNAQALAFDSVGNLWVLNASTVSVSEFTPTQLLAGGSPLPAVSITITAPGISTNLYPRAIAFDAQGDLWVGSPIGSVTYGAIVKYTPDQLTSSGTPVPAVSLKAQVSQPLAMAFDKAGNLWVSASPYMGNSVLYSGEISELLASSLTISGTPAPVSTLTLPPGNPFGAYPFGMAFDDSGNLWYTDFYNGWVGEFAAAQLAAGGNPSPAITITNASPVYSTGLAFNPHSGQLPLH